MTNGELDNVVLAAIDDAPAAFSAVMSRVNKALRSLFYSVDFRKIDRSLQRLRKRGAILCIRGKGGGWVKAK